MKQETASLLLEFNTMHTEKKCLFWQKWDTKIKILERIIFANSGNRQEEQKEVIEYWRGSEFIPKVMQNWREFKFISLDFYRFLRGNYPVPIPYFLFFSFENIVVYDIKDIYWAGNLADKWLKDIFSGKSFYKLNKKYFTRAEVHYFLNYDWYKSIGSYDDMFWSFINAKIKANNINLSPDIFYCFSDCFAHQIFIEYFKFLCNNKKYINNKDIEEINKFVKNEYILTGRNIDFKNHTYHSLKRLCDLSIMLKPMFADRCDNRIARDYCIFICKNVKRIKDKEEEIRDIASFLYNVGKRFSFKNKTWQELKRLSDKWYISNMFRGRIKNFNHKILQDYIIFICEKVKRFRGKEEEIRDIFDYLRAEYINTRQDFNFENMTWQELRRLSDVWHLEIIVRRERERMGMARIERDREKMLNAMWKKSSIKDFIYEKDGKTWIIKEITTGKSLYEEGKDMCHCVFSYVRNCIHGRCHIFSLSCKSGEDDGEKRIATVEISKSMKLTQARGKRNTSIDNETASIIKIWADENGIDCGDYLSNL